VRFCSHHPNKIHSAPNLILHTHTHTHWVFTKKIKLLWILIGCGITEQPMDGYDPSRKHLIRHGSHMWFKSSHSVHFSPLSSPPEQHPTSVDSWKKNNIYTHAHAHQIPPLEEGIISLLYLSSFLSQKTQAHPLPLLPWNLLRILVKNTKITGKQKCFSKMRSLIGIPSPCMVLVSFLSFHLISWGLGTYQRKDVFLFFFFEVVGQ